VETNRPGHQPSTNPTLLTRIGWAVLIIATLYVCYFSHLGALGFVGPDEPRYAWIARDMAESGDWVTPRLYGKPWFEKPPLLYWGAALSFKLFGVSEATARLPSAVSALLATLALAWLALRLYGAETARWLLLFLPTTVGMIGFSHAAATDMPFGAMLTIAMVAAAVVVGLGQETNETVVGDVAAGGALRPSSGQGSHSPTRVRLALICFGFFLGLAVLAKGPAGIILCGGSVFFWAVFTKRWRETFRLLHPAAIGAFCVTALPWYILCARRNSDFVRVFIIEHNFKRYLTPEFQHIQRFWYYIPILLIALVPWTGWSVSAVTYVFRKKLEMRPDTSSIYLLSWILFPLIFFSISKSKLPGYILPAVPPFVMLTAISLCRALRMPKVPVPAGFAVLALTPVTLAAAQSASTYIERAKWLPQDIAAVSAIIAVVSGTACLVFAWNGRRALLMASGVICLVMLVEANNILLLPSLDRVISARIVGQRVSKYPQSARAIVAFRLKRGWQYGLNFYIHREIEEWGEDSNQPVTAVVSLDGVAELRRRHLEFTVIDDSSFEAMVIQIGKPDPGKTKSNQLAPRAVGGNRNKKKLTTRFS